ncbi:MAG TPA: PHP domain-containing protein [Candidatus Baltobacteraceae bacterium]|jgi:hypothetical protein|nr:PHP domain-containing protein [Candidatus Baltobacteraceae bacterium]
MIVDFHSHTYESDGTLSPAELVAFMEERQVEIFSITDHDALGAYPRIADMAVRAKVIVGIEINTTYRDNEVHILGYGFPLGPSPIVDLLESNRRARELRVRRMVDTLSAAGIPLTFEEVLAESSAGATLGRPHVAKALIRKGVVPDVKRAFEGYLIFGKPGYVPSHHVTPQVAIDVIKGVGGIPVLAHPGRLKKPEIVDEMIAAGVQGIEVFYPQHTAEQTRAYRELTKNRRLLATAGSDFHDIRSHPHGVGMNIEREDIAAFLERVLP